MSYRGDINLGDTIDIKFCTVTTTGAPTQLAGSPVVSAYPDNSLTQLTAGITLTVDFDAVTGLNNVRVVATSGNGYATATNYDLVITTGTVGGTSVVGYVIGSFSIEKRSGLRSTTAGRTLDVSAGGEAGVDWANVGSPTTVVGLSGTTVKTATDVETDTADIQSRLPAALTAGGNIKADTLAWAGTATAATDIALKDTLAKGTDITGFNDLSAAQVNTEVDTAIADARLDELLAADSDIDGLTPPTVGSVFHEIMTKTAGSFTYDQTTDSLEALRDRGDAAWITATGFSTHSAADVWAVATRALTDKVDFSILAANRATLVDEIWDEDVDASHQTAGTAGKKLDDAGGAADPWSTALPGAYGAGTAGNILGNRLVGTIATGTHNPQSGDAYAIVNHVTYGNSAIETLVDELETRCTETRLAELDPANLPTDVANVQSDTNDIQARIPAALVGGRMDSNIDAALDTAGTELSAIPATTGTLRQKINFIFQYFRNKKTVTATTETLFKEDAATTLGTATVSDDGTTFTKGEAS